MSTATALIPHSLGPLGRRTFDDGFVVADGAGAFVLAGGDRRIEVAFEEGCPYAQVFAPPDDDDVGFEPMTAPTDALRGRCGAPPAVAPGETYHARFPITVSERVVEAAHRRRRESGASARGASSTRAGCRPTSVVTPGRRAGL